MFTKLLSIHKIVFKRFDAFVILEQKFVKLKIIFLNYCNFYIHNASNQISLMKFID